MKSGRVYRREGRSRYYNIRNLAIEICGCHELCGRYSWHFSVLWDVVSDRNRVGEATLWTFY